MPIPSHNYIMTSDALEDKANRLLEQLFRLGYELSWHLYLAKWSRLGRGTVCLLAHATNVASLAITLYLRFAPREKTWSSLKRLVWAAFLHDVGKQTDMFQKATAEAGRHPNRYHHILLQELEDFVNRAKTNASRFDEESRLTDTELDSLRWIFVQHPREYESLEHFQSSGVAVYPDDSELAEWVNLADALVSAKRVIDVPKRGRVGDVELVFEYHSVSVSRGILTQLLHRAIEKTYQAKGFHPILWFPDGTVYAASPSETNHEITSEEVLENLRLETLNLLNSIGAIPLARASIGQRGKRLVPSPELLFFSRGTIEEFVKNLASKLQSENPDTRDMDLLQYLKAAISECEELCKTLAMDPPPYAKILEEQFLNRLGIDKDLLSIFSKIANNIPREERIQILQYIRESQTYSKKSTEEWWSELIDSTRETLDKIRETLPPDLTVQAYKAFIFSRLIEDVTHPVLQLGRLSEIHKRYTEGKKKRGTPLCVVCGAAAEVEATASLFGGGSEAFHDMLVGGARIGGNNKLKVCRLCEYEAKLRSAMAGYARVAFYVFPMINIAPWVAAEWQKNATDMKTLETTRYKSAWDYHGWVKLALEDKIEPLNPPLNEPSAREISELKNILEDEVKDPAEAVEPGSTLQIQDHADLARKILAGKVKLRKGIEERVHAEMLRRSYPIILASNYVLIVLDRPLGPKNESHSASLIRTIFVASAIAKAFLANVMLTYDPYAPIFQHSSNGYVSFPTALSIRPLLEKLQIRSGYIEIKKIDEVLKRLASLLRVEEEIVKVNADYGRSTLLRVATELPGRVIQRYFNEKKHLPSVDFFRTLSTWWRGETPDLLKNYNTIPEMMKRR